MKLVTPPLHLIAAFTTLSLSFSPALAQQQPVVSNVQVGQRAGTKLVDITYNLAYSGGPVTVWVDVSSDRGRSYIVPAKTFSGHIGQGVSPGTNRAIVWNAEADFDGLLAEQMRVRINARAGVVPIPPPGMVLIPGGHFQMGEWVDGSSAGTRTVYISALFMDRYEVSGALWEEVKAWAEQNGYGSSWGSWAEYDSVQHPVEALGLSGSGRDLAIKWCNARSEKEGLPPVYYTDESHTAVYRGVGEPKPKLTANGYRLPSEAEWEKAARGGLSGKLYSWGDDPLDGSKGSFDEILKPVGYYNGDQTPSGNDMANNYGLYDMCGNVAEWCWERRYRGADYRVSPRKFYVFTSGAYGQQNQIEYRIGFRTVRGL